MKYKVGIAKVRDGTQARIYAIDGTTQFGESCVIHGAILTERGWEFTLWNSNGCAVLGNRMGSQMDLLPNVKPLKTEFTALVVGFKRTPKFGGIFESSLTFYNVEQNFEALIDRNVRVTLEEIL